MLKTYDEHKLFSVEPHKRFSRPCEFGFGIFGYTKYGDEFVGIAMQPLGRAIFGDFAFGEYVLLSGIYIAVKRFGLRETMRVKFYRPRNPQTVLQQTGRTKFANAVIAWQSLTTEQKKVYNKKAVGKHKSGYNIKISEFMSS